MLNSPQRGVGQDPLPSTLPRSGRKARAQAMLSQASLEPVRHFNDSILDGKPWYLALLEAIGLWSVPEEVYKGHYYRYLIAGEAFDWLLLAQRLFDEVDGLVPARQRYQLLAHGRFPCQVSEKEFRDLTGVAKYRGILNYWYGVTVEGALQLAVAKEVAKERMSKGISNKGDIMEEAFHRIYGEPRSSLWGVFPREKGQSESSLVGEPDVKEFTYWLFKLRLKRCEKARIASDTRKGLEFLGKSHALPFAPNIKSLLDEQQVVHDE